MKIKNIAFKLEDMLWKSGLQSITSDMDHVSNVKTRTIVSEDLHRVVLNGLPSASDVIKNLIVIETGRL